MNTTHQELSYPSRSEKIPVNGLFRLFDFVRNWQMALLTVSIFMTIAGARLLVLKHFGSDIPLWDQWGAEANEFYRPFFQGTLSPEFFFSSHNEHRILFSRLLSLGLLLLNGLWDMHLQTVVNALIYSIVGTGLFWFAGQRLGAQQRLPWYAAVAVIFSLPYGWENSLWGFQSQFYLLVGFSLLVMSVSWLPISNTVLQAIMLLMVQVSALFTMGSGVLAPLTVVAVQLLAFVRNRGEEAANRTAWLRMIISIAVVIAGFMIMAHVPEHDRYRAPTVAHLVTVFAHSASWPDFQSGLWWGINWLPFAILGILFVFRRTVDNPLHRFALSFGLWVLLQELATAYSRNGLAMRSKYSDISALCLVVNVLSMLILFGCFNRFWKRGAIFFALLWGATNLYHLGQLTMENLNFDLPQERYSHELQRENTLLFLRYGDPSLLIGKNRWEIPHTNGEAYANLLRDPFILSILPRSINYPAAITGKPAALLSTAAVALADISLPLMICGLLLMTVMIVDVIIKYFEGSV